MQLLIVRHGESLGQIRSQNASAGPDSTLTPLGEEQSRRTGRFLASAGVTQLLSSPMLRALGTATLIAEAISCERIQVWTELRELWERTYRGLGADTLRERFPHAVLPPDITAAGWEHGDDDFASMFARCQTVLRLLRERFTGADTIVMVTHGGFINYLLHALLNIPPTLPTWFRTENCSITRIHFVPDNERSGFLPWYPPVPVKILAINDTHHLSNST